MRTTLDPKLDVVFKLLFGDERNSGLLIRLLNAILRRKSPITEVRVLNPGVPKDAVDDKSIILDIRVTDAAGEQYDVEMQCQPRPARRKRALYYTTALYAGQLTQGAEYHRLMPVHGIWIADFEELSGDRFHSVFRLLELHNHEEFTDDFELHWIELPKLGSAIESGDEPELVNFAKFLKAESDEELEELAMSDPNIREAKQALDHLSADPEARALAEERYRWHHFHQEDMDMAREEGELRGLRRGEELGLRRGEELGLRKGRVETIETLCQVFDIALDADRQEQLDHSDAAALDNLLDHLRTHRRWPDG